MTTVLVDSFMLMMYAHLLHRVGGWKGRLLLIGEEI
jgi:hypothetical protein